ncbi:hypothetical protein ACQ86B_17415 [Mycolicibacterium aichiense]|uniref:hypothetical protein n=1 Tax=Mycolicibacterium aichiense TaxID=1799 RepID=UPI003D67F333
MNGLTHGWRWYRIKSDRLVSPLSPTPVELPPDGELFDCYIVPSVEKIGSMAAWITQQQLYPFALTYGSVEGPFEKDHDMPRIGSIKVGRYQALTIFTNTHGRELAEHYRLPVRYLALS